MKKIMWVIMLFMFVAGCKENNVEAPSITTEENQALEHISNKSNQIETKSVKFKEEKSVDFQKSTEINKAENLVRQYLELGDSPDTIVEFDHKKNGGYVIHVYDVIDKGAQTEHSVTRGWFLVKLDPENIKVLK